MSQTAIWEQIVSTMVGAFIGYTLSWWLAVRVLTPWLTIRDARKRIDAALGETKRVRRAIRRGNRQH